ncbi:hypothetical protein GCM10027347_31620 [Larkinella harenae]
MVAVETFRQLALALPEAVEQPHFEKTSFRVARKIVATLDEPNLRACLKLSESDQDLFSVFDKTVIYPVPNKWGKQGWTFIELQKVPEEMLRDALTAAYCAVAPKRLAGLVRPAPVTNS